MNGTIREKIYVINRHGFLPYTTYLNERQLAGSKQQDHLRKLTLANRHEYSYPLHIPSNPPRTLSTVPRSIPEPS